MYIIYVPVWILSRYKEIISFSDFNYNNKKSLRIVTIYISDSPKLAKHIKHID